MIIRPVHALWDRDSGNGTIRSGDQPNERVTVGSGSAPASRRVLLMSEKSYLVIRMTWSDDAGRFAFDNLNLDRTYTVTAIDHTRQFHPTAIAGVQPFPQS